MSAIITATAFHILLCKTILCAIQVQHEASSALLQTHNDLETEVNKYYSSCVVHFVQLTDKVEFPIPTSFPLITDVWTKEMNVFGGHLKRNCVCSGEENVGRQTIEDGIYGC